MNCDACGSAFEPTHGSQRFCKDEQCGKDRVRARYKKWYDRQPRAKLNEQQQNYRGRTDVAKRGELKKYGITLEQWASMVSYVDSRCEICGTQTEDLCVDHDHDTGEVRGVLCRACNRSIGQLGDTAESLRKAADYLAKTRMGRNVPRSGSSLGVQEHLF